MTIMSKSIREGATASRAVELQLHIWDVLCFLTSDNPLPLCVSSGMAKYIFL